ncbi:MAG: hypothetical protein M3077_02945 [Candidatus Dormibacteraeota bacterium]|nr:hypothetical protein [Candidatus Dormibacteraeota bacterium]
MQLTDDTGCLTQRSQLEHLREMADAVVQERVKELVAPTATLATVLVVLGAGHQETTWDVESLVSSGARLDRGTSWMADPDIALSNFVPTQAIVRILRETGASAAALIAPVATNAVAMQLADADHEQSLTARVIRQPDTTTALGKWDFGSVLWTVRLRQMLLASGASSRNKGMPATPPVRPVTGQTAAQTTPAAGRRGGQMREMREQLQREAAAAPSWLQ